MPRFPNFTIRANILSSIFLIIVHQTLTLRVLGVARVFEASYKESEHGYEEKTYRGQSHDCIHSWKDYY